MMNPRIKFAILSPVLGTLACASSPRAIPETGVTTQSTAARTMQVAEIQGAFVTRLGNDTVAVETYRRTSDVLEGALVLRVPRTRVIRYRAELGAGGRITSFESTVTQPPGGTPARPVRLEIGADSITARVPSGDTVRVQRRAVEEGIAVPWIGNSWALAEQAIMHALVLGRDSVTLLQVGVAGTPPQPTFARRRGAGHVEIGYFGDPMVIRLDEAGRILSVDGMATTNKATAERVASVDIDALARDFAARDAAGRGLGTLSIRDTTRAVIGGAELMVDYSRPSARGRTIWGGVVPWGQVWRTGANQATHFSTTRELVIGGTVVPAGTYTLWTLPRQQGTQLIINRRTGEWGTSYDPSQDLARIDVAMEPLPERAEQFTIAIEQADASSGVMRLMWDDRAIRVPFTVR